MDLVTLFDWVYAEVPFSVPPYAPDAGVGRHWNTNYNTPSPYQPNVYRPKELVENFDSLIWREGFRTSGSFELKSYDIHGTLNMLPTGTLVSLRDTDEVYIVTTHHIGTNEAGEDVLTVNGKSLLIYILENRPTWAYIHNPPIVSATHINLTFQIPDHLAFILWGGIVFPFSEGGYNTGGKPFELPDNIIVPHTAISQSIATTKGDFYRTEWPAPIETRLASVSGMLELDQKWGVRTIRPKDKTALIYNPTLTSRFGEGSTVVTPNVSKMLFDIYEGIDRTIGENRVMFRHDAGDITSAEYIQSIELYKEVVSVHADMEGSTTSYPPVYSEILWQADAAIATDNGAGEPVPIIPPHPDTRKEIAGVKFTMGEVASSAKLPATGAPPPALLARIQADGFKYLRENKELEVMTADISPQTQYKYKEDYDLGDIVFVQGKYGTMQKMLVSEYTRTSDANGVSGYPTLVRWEDPNDKI